jgi:SAM-dependent methyltransferase
MNSTAARDSFDEDPDSYQHGRPGYPDRLFDVLSERCGLGPGARVLEIGPGTGQATRSLLARGAEVTAVELGANLGERLRAELQDPRLTVVTGDIAEVPLPAAAFDLAVCATAFHWLEPAVVLPRIAAALQPGGTLAVWWTIHDDPRRSSAYKSALGELYGAHFPELRGARGSTPDPLDAAARNAELATGGHFAAIESEVLQWDHRLTAATARSLFASFSNLRTRPAERREAFLDDLAALIDRDFEGEVTDHYVTGLYTARRVR